MLTFCTFSYHHLMVFELNNFSKVNSLYASHILLRVLLLIICDLHKGNVTIFEVLADVKTSSEINMS